MYFTQQHNIGNDFWSVKVSASVLIDRLGFTGHFRVVCESRHCNARGSPGVIFRTIDDDVIEKRCLL